MSTGAFPGSDPSNIRIGDAERNSAAEALGEHLSSGRLDLDEFGTRSAQVSQARTVADLRALFVDLPAPHPNLPGPAPAIRPAADLTSRSGDQLDRPRDNRTPAQRTAAVALALSGIISVLLFFVFKTWVVFLLPAVIGVLTSTVWGNGGRDGNRR